MAEQNEIPALIYREDRRIRSPFLWIFLVLASSFVLGSLAWIVQQRLSLAGTSPEAALSTTPYLGVVALLAASWLGTLLLIALVVLQIEVTTAGLFVRLWPLQRKVRKIPLEDALRVRALRFRPILDYGGFGIRRNRHGAAYILGTGEGVRIDYENGYHLLIETAHPWDLEEAIKSLLEPDAASGDAAPPTA